MGQILVQNGRTEISGETEGPSLPLQGRQRDCIMLVKKGLTSKQIARELGISPRTVDQHIGAALVNLGVPNRTAAVALIHELETQQFPAVSDQPLIISRTEELGDPVIHSGLTFSGSTNRITRPKIDHVLPRLGGTRNTARPTLRINWIFRIAMLSSMLTCFIVLSIIAASALADGLVE